MRSISILLLNIFYLHLFAFSQEKAVLSGHVLTSDGKPAEGISVTLQQASGLGASTNTSGYYEIKNVPFGQYTLRVSAVGLAGQTRQISVQSSAVSLADFTLTEDASTLQEVIIQGNKANPFTRKSSDYVAKQPLKNLENPQVYTVITKELLKSQMVTNFDDALMNSPGLDRLWSSTGRPSDGAGYFSLRGFATQPSMVNGIPSLINGSPDPANIEQIEVIKGPSGALYGGAVVEFGGLININTKKPIDTLGGEVAYTLGSYGQHRVTADVYGPLSSDKKLTGRLNAAYNRRGTFQDVGINKSIFVAPSLKYAVNDRLSIQAEAEIYTSEATNALMVFLNRSRPLIATKPSELQFDFNKSYTADDVRYKNPTTNLRGLVSYRISDKWTSNTNITYNRRKSDGYYQYVMYLEPDNDTLISRMASKQYSVSQVVDIQQNFQGEFLIGSVRNRLLVGLDFLHQVTDNDNAPYPMIDQINTSFDDPRYYLFNRALIDERIATSPNPYTRNQSLNDVYSAYFSDVVDFTDAFHVMLALRADHFNNRGTRDNETGIRSGDFKQTAFSPKVGVVYEVVKNQISLFANYLNGFKNVAPVVQPLPDVSGNFKPQHANQLEGGIKMDVLHNRLAITANYYDISVSNITRSETIERNGEFYNITVQNGTQLSRGFEFETTAQPVNGLNIILGYSNNYSKITKADEYVNDRRPVDAGPKHLVNLWASYSLQRGFAKGLGFGFGGNYASENMITNYAGVGTFTLPAYTLLNASIFYDAKSFRIGFKANNITDRHYFKGWTTVEPQTPRNYLGTIAYKF